MKKIENFLPLSFENELKMKKIIDFLPFSLNKELKMNKKSLFFALSIFLLASTLLSISFLISEYVSKDSSKRFVELSALDRVHDLSISIEKSLSEILNLSFIIPAVIIENDDGTYNVTVRESISRDRQEWSSELETTMQNFKQFVEERESSVEMNIDAIENKELPFKIVPHNITYSRSWQIGHVILSVVPEQINFGTLSVLVEAGNLNISSVNSNFGNSGSVLFSVNAIDNFGFNDLKERFVDPDSNSQIQVFFKNGNKVRITLNDNELQIWTNSAEKVSITTSIGNLNDLNERPSLDYFGSILVISIPGLGVSMASPLIPQ